jgi:hypothetical protein
MNGSRSVGGAAVIHFLEAVPRPTCPVFGLRVMIDNVDVDDTEICIHGRLIALERVLMGAKGTQKEV